MPYATKLDLENTYGEELVVTLADHDDDGIAEEEAINDALEAASSIIDAYIAARYTVPVSPGTPALRDMCIDIAWYRLAYSRLKQTAEMRLRYEDAIKLLIRIGEGKASIGVDVTGPNGEPEGISDDVMGGFTARTAWLERA